MGLGTEDRLDEDSADAGLFLGWGYLYLINWMIIVREYRNLIFKTLISITVAL